MAQPASIIGGANIHISCFASLISFQIDYSYGLSTQIYEYSPLQLSTLATPLCINIFFTIHIEGSLKTTTIPSTESYDNEIITFKYYVLPTELFKELQNEIEKEIKIYMPHSDRTLAQRGKPPQLPPQVLASLGWGLDYIWL